jgi:hypothetical protein
MNVHEPRGELWGCCRSLQLILLRYIARQSGCATLPFVDHNYWYSWLSHDTCMVRDASVSHDLSSCGLTAAVILINLQVFIFADYLNWVYIFMYSKLL